MTVRQWDSPEEAYKYILEMEAQIAQSSTISDGAPSEPAFTTDHIANNYRPGGSTPSQYALPPTATELQDLIEHRNMNFAVGNIFKAGYRLGTCEHSDAARDLRKIIWFARRELARLEDAE